MNAETLQPVAVETLTPEVAQPVEAVEATKQADPAPSENPESVTPPEPKKPHWSQRRIDELTREKYEAQAQIQKLIETLAGKQPAEPQRQAPAASGAPNIKDFADYGEYLGAQARWSARQEFAQMEQARTARQTEERSQQEAANRQKEVQGAATKWRSMTGLGEQKYPDFYEKVHSDQVPITPVVAEAIVSSDAGHEIAYYLGTHLEDAARIAGLSPVNQVREIGKLEARLSQSAKSNAPAPISPLNGGKQPATDAPKDTEDMDTWVKKREAQLRSK